MDKLNFIKGKDIHYRKHPEWEGKFLLFLLKRVKAPLLLAWQVIHACYPRVLELTSHSPNLLALREMSKLRGAAYKGTSCSLWASYWQNPIISPAGWPNKQWRTWPCLLILSGVDSVWWTTVCFCSKYPGSGIHLNVVFQISSTLGCGQTLTYQDKVVTRVTTSPLPSSN